MEIIIVVLNEELFGSWKGQLLLLSRDKGMESLKSTGISITCTDFPSRINEIILILMEASHTVRTHSLSHSQIFWKKRKEKPFKTCWDLQLMLVRDVHKPLQLCSTLVPSCRSYSPMFPLDLIMIGDNQLSSNVNKDKDIQIEQEQSENRSYIISHKCLCIKTV